MGKPQLYSNSTVVKTVAVTLDVAFNVCRGLNAAAAGTAALTYADGSTDTVYLTAGWNPVSCVKVSTSGTSATSIKACY